MEENLLGQQIPLAIIASTLIEWLKAKPWFPFAKIDGPTMNKIFSAVVAIVAAVGIHVTFDPVLDGGTMIITGLNLASIAHGAWAAIQQYALQHFVYWTAVKDKS